MILSTTAIWFVSVYFNGVFSQPQKGSTDLNDNDLWGTLQDAIVQGKENEVRRLIMNAVSINATNEDDDSALIFAASQGQIGIVKVLIENGADINHKNDNGRTALMTIVGTQNTGSEDIVQLLIDKGVYINVVDKNGHTALDVATVVHKKGDSEEVIHLLTENGAERGGTLLYRKTALQACRLYSNLTARWKYGIGGGVSGESSVEAGEFPWIVALGYIIDEFKLRFLCSGSLISDTFVLTAAHCIKENNRPAVVRLGKVSLADEDGLRSDKTIDEIILHPEYTFIAKKNDIALIRLADRLFITKFIQPICLQTRLNDEDIRTDLITAGWGRWNDDLLKINLKTMPLSECSTMFLNNSETRNSPSFRNGLDQSQYCAHDPIANKSSCVGDSGGPLQTMQTYSNPAKLVGVVSFGVGCNSGLPDIHARIAHYIEWIGSHVWPNGEIQTPRINTGDKSDEELFLLAIEL